MIRRGGVVLHQGAFATDERESCLVREAGP